jgi:hypothetical protein
MSETRTRTPEGRTIVGRRVAQALALFTAPWCFVVANTGDVLTNPHGLDDTTARGALLTSAAHPLVDKWLSFVALVGCLLLVPAVLGAMSLLRSTAARLGLVGGVLMVAGYVCYFGLVFQGYATIALAQHGGATPDHLAVTDLTTDQGFFVVVALTFVLGNIVGTFLLGLALVRARVVPRWAGLCVLAWPVLHVLGGAGGEVAGAVLQAVGFAVVGQRLWRSADGVPGASAYRPREAELDLTRRG